MDILQYIENLHPRQVAPFKPNNGGNPEWNIPQQPHPDNMPKSVSDWQLNLEKHKATIPKEPNGARVGMIINNMMNGFLKDIDMDEFMTTPENEIKAVLLKLYWAVSTAEEITISNLRAEK